MNTNLNKRGPGNPTSPYTLNKFKPGKREHVLDDSVLDDATRRMLLEDIMRAKPPAKPSSVATSTAHDDSKKIPSKGPSAPDPAGGTQSNTLGGSDDLLVIMTQRLKTLENNQRVMQLELKEKSRKIIELEDRLSAEKETRQQSTQQKASLQKELGEILHFLGEHGLTWEGSYEASTKDNSASTDESINTVPEKVKQKAPALSLLYEGNFKMGSQGSDVLHTPQPPREGSATAPRLFSSTPSNAGVPISKELSKQLTPKKGTENGKLPFDLDLLKRNCQILSDHVGNQAFLGDGQRKILREREKVFVCVYSDGICVNSGPFRPYGWALCDAFLNDLLEGYYPYEFKDRYPDGYPLEVVDKSTEKCPTNATLAPSTTKTTFTGAGHKLGGTSGTIKSFSDHRQQEGVYKPLTREEFLKRLPERYVAPGGRLVNVREGIKDLVEGKHSPAIPQKETVRTNVERLLQQAAENKKLDEEIRKNNQQMNQGEEIGLAVSAQGEIVGTGGTAPVTPEFLTTIRGSTPASAELARRQTSQDEINNTDPTTGEPIVTLQIRLPQGQRCVLNMFEKDAILDVRREFERAVPDFFSGRPNRNAYELACVFPRKVCIDHTATLLSLGLYPNATLMLRLTHPDVQ